MNFEDIEVYDSKQKKYITCLYTDYEEISIKYINKPIKKIKKQIFSKYNLPGYFSVMHKLSLNIPKDNVILAIGYSIGDIQLTITGSQKYREQTFETAIREIREELGLMISEKDLNYMDSFKNQKQTAFYYSLDIDQFKTCDITDTYLHNDNYDYSRTKVCIIVHGSFDKIKKLLSKAVPTDTNEAIAFYSMIPFTNALEIASYIDIKQDNLFIW